MNYELNKDYELKKRGLLDLVSLCIIAKSLRHSTPKIEEAYYVRISQ